MCPSDRIANPGWSTTTTPSDFWPAFEILDADRDGKISKDDLRVFYTGISGGGSEDELIGAMISVADENRDGFVQYAEFEKVLGHENRRSGGGGVMEDVFRVMDKDGDGRLSHQDLKSYMECAGLEASDEDISAMIRLAAGDDGGGVSFNGLLKILAVDSNMW